MNAVFIPARARSKGLPHKNRRIVGGNTLISRCVETCRKVTPEIYVCTDDPWIENDLANSGVNLVPRPKLSCEDDAIVTQVIRWMYYYIDREWEKIAFVQCTAPLMTSSDLQAGFDALTDDIDLVVSVVPYHGIIFNEESELINFNWRQSVNRQERELQYESAGAMFVFRPEHLDMALHDGKIGLVLADHPYKCDIDSEEDLCYADMVIRGECPRPTKPVCASDTVC